MKFRPPRGGVTRIVRAKYVGGSVYSDAWRAMAAEILERDKYTCQVCGRHKKVLNALGLQLQVDHIKPKARGGTDSKLNLRATCEPCHAKRPHHEHLRSKIGAAAATKKKKLALYFKLTRN